MLNYLMSDKDLVKLEAGGWKQSVLSALVLLGYELADYDAVTCEAEFYVDDENSHGFSLHRNDTLDHLRNAIFMAGEFRARKTAGDALRSLFRATDFPEVVLTST